MTDRDEPILDLNFVPAWARRPPDQNPYAHFVGRKEHRAFRDRERPCPGKSPRNAARSSRTTPAAVDRPARREPPASKPMMYVDVSFIPEQHGLKPLARQLGRTGRAYALLEVAAMFLSKPEYYAVKLETHAPNASTPATPLYQCTVCKAVFPLREPVATHALKQHFNSYYDKEEKTGDPPKGHFHCVARCSLSGELLGPPNYHGYNDKLLELHRSRFGHLALEDYRKKIINDPEPALLEQWKQAAARQVLYRTRQAKEPLTFTRYLDVETHFFNCYAPALIRAGHRFILPGPVSRELEDPVMRQAVQEAWNRENHFPLKLAIVLQPAFRHLGLHVFKTPQRAFFVTAIPPHPIDPAKTTPEIRSCLEYLSHHPGQTRQELVQALQPGLPPDAPDVAGIIHSLRWLIEKGHVIEFANGHLAVPALRPTAGTARPAMKSDVDKRPPTKATARAGEPNHG